MPDDLGVPRTAASRGRMTAMVWEVLIVIRDTACAIALFLLACLVAGLLRQAIPVDYPNLYIIWFAFGMIPFLLFAHWRGALRITWRTVVVLTAAFLVWSLVPMAIFDGPGGMVLYPVVAVCVFWLGDRVSAWIAPDSSRSKHRTG